MPFFSRKNNKKVAAAPADVSEKPKPAPYRHRPTHAASDSVSMTPSGSRNGEKSAIRDAHQKRMSHNNSSQSLAAFASSNSLLRRNSSGFTATSAPAGASTMSLGAHSPTNVPRHLGYAAYEFDYTSNSVPKVGCRPAGKSPLSSPPISPVDLDASHSEADSENSLDLNTSKPQASSAPQPQSRQRSRHHSRTSSTAIPVSQLAAITRQSRPLPASSAASIDSAVAPIKRPVSVAASQSAPPTKSMATVTVAPVAPIAFQKRRSRWMHPFGGKNNAIAAH